MDYNRAAATVDGKVEAYLRHAEAVGKPGAVVVGLAISDWDDAAPPAWQTRSETELEQLMTTTAGHLAMYFFISCSSFPLLWVEVRWECGGRRYLRSVFPWFAAPMCPNPRVHHFVHL